MLSKPGKNILKITVIGLIGLAVFLLLNRWGGIKSGFASDHIIETRSVGVGAKTVDLDYNWELFYSAVEKEQKYYSEELKKIYGGIIPHHDLVSEYMAELFVRLKRTENPQTIIILGPNHAGRGLETVISGRVDWRTPFGTVKNDYEKLDQLVERGLVVFDNDNFIPEHSIKTTVAFISHYFSEADIVPLVITNNKDTDHLEKLASELAEFARADNTLIIGSFDFSHYLSDLEAEQRDQITWQAILDRNYDLILTFDNSYIDAPSALFVFLRSMDQIGAGQAEILRHTNSGRYLKKKQPNSTSYFTVLFSKPN